LDETKKKNIKHREIFEKEENIQKRKKKQEKKLKR